VTPKWSFKYNPEEDKNKDKSEKTEKKAQLGPMPISEAIQILQVPNEFNLEQVEERYNKLLKINDPNKGGSFYIQCKITGARQTLVQALIPPEMSEEVEKAKQGKEASEQETKPESPQN
jgi:chromosomal replication initiation ATPase DnaA